MAASSLGPVTSAAHHVVQSTYMFFCTCGDAVSQAAQSFLPGKVRHWHSISLACAPLWSVEQSTFRFSPAILWWRVNMAKCLRLRA